MTKDNVLLRRLFREESGEVNGVAWLQAEFEGVGGTYFEWKVSPHGEDDPDNDAWWTDDPLEVVTAIMERED